MIISRLILKNFGKFKNKEIELHDRINLIYGPNEAGKSTVHKFIEGMLYGFFKPYVKRKVYTSDYDKYKPWSGEGYEGLMDIEDKDRSYRIHRKLNKHDEGVWVYDNRTGQDLSQQCQYDKKTRLITPGTLFGDMSLSVYRNIMSVPQLQVKLEDDHKELRDYFMKDDNNPMPNLSINRVLKELNDKKDEIGSASRSRSEYGKLYLKLQELKRKRKDCLLAQDELNNYYQEMSNSKEELQDIQMKLYQVNDELEKMLFGAETNYKVESLKDEMKKLQNKLKNFRYFQKLSLGELDKAFLLFKEYNILQNKVLGINKTKKYNYTFILVLGLIIEILLIPASIWLSPYILIGSILNLAIVTYFMMKQKKGKRVTQKIQLLEEERTSLNIWIDNEEEYMNMRNTVMEYEHLMSRLKDKESELNNLNTGSQTLMDNENTLKQQKDNLENERIDIEKNITKYEERINHYNQSIGSLQEIREEIMRLEDQLASYDKNIEAIDVTMDILNKVAKTNQLTNHKDLNQQLSKQLAYITKGKYNEVVVNEKFQVTIKDKEEYRMIDPEDVSSGTKDQIYIALRMAMLTSIDNNYPIIFDDSFIQFDDERLENFLKYIIENMNERQVIIMTCQKREKNILDRLKVEYAHITL